MLASPNCGPWPLDAGMGDDEVPVGWCLEAILAVELDVLHLFAQWSWNFLVNIEKVQWVGVPVSISIKLKSDRPSQLRH